MRKKYRHQAVWGGTRAVSGVISGRPGAGELSAAGVVSAVTAIRGTGSAHGRVKPRAGEDQAKTGRGAIPRERRVCCVSVCVCVSVGGSVEGTRPVSDVRGRSSPAAATGRSTSKSAAQQFQPRSPVGHRPSARGSHCRLPLRAYQYLYQQAVVGGGFLQYCMYVLSTDTPPSLAAAGPLFPPLCAPGWSLRIARKARSRRWLAPRAAPRTRKPPGSGRRRLQACRGKSRGRVVSTPTCRVL